MSKVARTIRTIGSSSYPVIVAGTAGHNFERVYYQSNCSAGDVRGKYEDLKFTSTGSGETHRLRAIASGTGVATGGTVNAMHATMQVASGGTISGAAHAIRATYEVAGSTPTPGGTNSALQVDTNAVTGTVFGVADAFISIANIGAGKLTNVLQVPTPAAKTAYLTDPFVAVHADSVVTHALKICDAAGTVYWIQCTTDTPND